MLKKSIAFIFFLGVSLVSFFQSIDATILTTTVTYDLDGGINHPHNPETFNEFEDFYFGEASKEGHIFLGWFTDLSDENTQVARSKDVVVSSLTLYAKFEPLFNITYNPNNGDEPFELPANTGVRFSNNTYNGRTYSGLLVELPAISDGLVTLYNVINSNILFARNPETGTTITLGTLPSQNIRLTHLQVINNKTYVFGIQSSSLSSTFNIYAVEIDNVDNTPRSTPFPNFVTANISNPSSSRITNINMEVIDYNNDGAFEIFFKWSDSFVGSTSPRYAVIAYEFNDQALTLTRTIEHVLSYRISDYEFYDIDQDGIKEIITMDSSSGNVRIFSYDALDNTFTVLEKTISLVSFTDYIYSNRVLGETMFIGNIKGGNQVYIAYLVSDGFSSSNFIHLNYFGIKPDFSVTDETPVGSRLATRLFQYTGEAIVRGVQIDLYGNHAFVGIAKYSSSFSYATITQHPIFDYFTVNAYSGNSTNSSMYAYSYFNGETGYIISPEIADRQIITNFSKSTSFPSAPVVRPGYRFLDWFTTSDFQAISEINGGARINRPIEVYAKWDPLQYVVTFRTNGGTSVPQTSIVFDSVLEKPTEPTRAHYRFLGWKVQGETEFYDFTLPYTYTSNKTLDAYWENLVYEVTHVTNTNQTIDNYEANSLSNYTLPTNLEKEGHILEGWYTSADFSTQKLASTISLNLGDITIYAKWTVQNYDIEFLLPDGTIYEKQTFAFGDDITGLTEPETNPEVTGTIFKGWETNELITMPASNIQLKMLFDALSYDLVYVTNGGNTIETTQILFNETLTIAIPTREGYSFDGWYSDEALTTRSTLTNMPAVNTTLYAKWTINQYTITFDSQEGSQVASITQHYDTPITSPENPTRIGFTFNGWDQPIPQNMPAFNLSIKALWTINTYTISFDSNQGSQVASMTQNYNTIITTPENPTRLGYTFNHWFSDRELNHPYEFSTMPSENITLYAKWDIVTYSINFELNGGTLNPNQVSTYTVESLDVMLLTPTRDGYVFKGYFTEATFETALTLVLSTRASDITVYALFFANAFNTYYEDVNSIDQTISIEDKEKILSYLDTYDTLTTFEKGFIERTRLEDALTMILNLEVERVMDAISAINAQISRSDENDIEAVKALFDALSLDQQILVSNQDLLQQTLDILDVVKSMYDLLNTLEPTEDQFNQVQDKLETLQANQVSRIDEKLYNDYLQLKASFQTSSPWPVIISLFSILWLLILGYMYYRYKKNQQKK